MSARARRYRSREPFTVILETRVAVADLSPTNGVPTRERGSRAYRRPANRDGQADRLYGLGWEGTGRLLRGRVCHDIEADVSGRLLPKRGEVLDGLPDRLERRVDRRVQLFAGGAQRDRSVRMIEQLDAEAPLDRLERMAGRATQVAIVTSQPPIAIDSREMPGLNPAARQSLAWKKGR